MSALNDFDLADIASGENLLAKHNGDVLLLVNVASECGYTPQYAELQALHTELSDKGFAVLGAPCNQFGAQEPGDEQAIQAFCDTRYGVTFPMSRKLEVNGPKRHPLYAWLTAPEQGMPGDIEWNFEKFLIGRDGRPLSRYPAATSPKDNGLLQDIAEALSGAA